MSDSQSAADIERPIKRTTGDTLDERLTSNAYDNVLPARYLQKDAEGSVVERQEELFDRVAKNIALAEAVYEAGRRGETVTVEPDQVKPDHPRRDELVAEVFDEAASVEADAGTALTEENVNKFAYETIVPELSGEIAAHVQETAAEFRELMERLAFMPNSPTLMNAGDELQQLSACFVDSPADDIDDIHETAKEAAQVFQCLTADSTVVVENKGTVSVSEVEVGDRIAQRTESGFQYKPVEETHTYEDAETLTVTFANGLDVRGTPNHRLLIDGEWIRLDEIRAGQEVHYALGWLREINRETPVLESVASGGQWETNRTVENTEILELYREGLSDYEIAERLDCGKSTVQRRRSHELDLPPNGSGGRPVGSTSFDEETALELYEQGHSDAEVADTVGVTQAAIAQFRAREKLASNGTPVKTVQQPERLTESLAELVGLWIGDGSYHEDGVRFHVNRESVVDYIDELSRQLFGTAPSVSFADGCHEVAVNSHEIRRWWETNFDCKPDGAQSAHVPAVVKQAPADVIRAFIRGYFTADGTLLDETYPKLYSASERAIDDVATLMMGLGYPVKKSVIRDEDAHPYYGLVPTTGDGRRSFLREVGFIDERRETGLASLDSVTSRDSHAVGDEYTVTVESVVESAPATVYDITVADNHEYVTDGVVSHNSGGGMGYAFWQLRPYGDPVGSTGGIASGPITFMRTFDQMCFPPGTSVLTPDGQRAIEDLRMGDLVIDENGDTQPIVETMEREVDEEIVELVPERINDPIRATAEHPFKVARNGEFEWVDASDVEEGDYLVLGHASDDNGFELDETVDLSEVASGPLVFTDGGVRINREYYGANKGPRPGAVTDTVPVSALATVAGWYLAEGCVVHRRGVPNEVTFTLHADETEAAEEITDALAAFGVETRLDPVPDRNTLHVHAESASFAQLIEELFGTGASEKHVPEFLWNAPVETQARVVEALFDGDGTTETRGDSQRVTLQLTCEEVIDWVFQVGLRCGVQFSRHRRTPEDRKPTHWVSASVSTALGTPLERLFEEVPDDFRAVDRTKQVEGHQVVAVDSVERVAYDGPVYNAEVAGTHTYVAEDLVVHNCETIAQGGARRGAQMGVMRVSHPDVIQFIHAKNKDVSLARSLRLNDPDDFTHTSFADALTEARELIEDDGTVPEHLRNAVEGHLSNFNISVGITDEFMEAVKNDEEFTFTNPRTGEAHVATRETQEIYEMFGLGEHVEVGEELSVPAREIWDDIVEGAHENGEPGVVYLERINKQHSFDVEEHPDHRILATNPCLTGDTEVALADGTTQSLESLASDGEDVRVLCRDSETGELTVRVGRNPRQTRPDADLVQVTTEQGASLRCTPDHEVWTPDGYVEAKNLSVGDTVVGTRTTAVPAGSASESVSDHLTVTEVTDVGSGAVYNITVDEHHNYLATTDAGETFISVANCGEQPLEEYEACNLGHVNLSTLAAENAPDWRVWSEEHGYDTLEDGIAGFLAEAIDWEEFDHRIAYGTRFLENVVTMSNFPVEEIEETVAAMRKIGLGIMGLAQLYVQLGVRYGDDAANEIARQLMTHINHESKSVSHELAEERGVFDEWDESKYADPTEYAEWFEHHTGENPEDWPSGYKIRNHNTTTIAPTGTTSMVGNTTGGCEPIYNVAYYKNVSDDVQGDEMLVEFDDYFLRTLEANDIDVDAVKREAQEQMADNAFDGVDGLETVPDAIGELFVTTGELDALDHAGVQVACQQGVDSAISKCLEAGTLVQTDSGVRPIESFSEETPEPDTFVDVDEDVTVDGVPVESQYYAGEEDATRVRVDNGTEIVGATDSHKLLTPDGWRSLGELEPGDRVVGRLTESHGTGGTELAFDPGVRSVHERDASVPAAMSPRLARFLGMYAADGSAIDERYSIEIATSSERVRAEAVELFTDLFDRDPYVETDDRGGNERDAVYNIGVNAKLVWEFVTELSGSGAYEKTVPHEVLVGSPAEKRAFVDGVTLDGYVTPQSLVVYGGMSQELADGVAELLRSFGVPKVYIGRKWVDESDAYSYQVHVTNEAHELVTPVEPHKRIERQDQRYRVYVPQDRVEKTDYYSRSEEYYAARNFEYTDRDSMFDTTAKKLGVSDAPPLHEVTEVEDAGTREMYDIELAGPHEYVVGGVVSHNTVNAPNDSTIEDAKRAFEYIYDNGGKGVTYYRDGTRSKQVLTTRAENTEFADMGEAEAAAALVEQIDEVFGGVEAFVEHEAVREAVDGEIATLLEQSERPQVEVQYTEKRPRPDSLTGVTQLIETGYGKLYVTINEDPKTGEPFELFANIGHSGGFTNSFTESLAKVISTALRSGVDPEEIVDELQGTRSPKVAWDKGEQIQSIPDAIGTALRRYLDNEIDRAYPEQRSLDEIDESESSSGESERADEPAAAEPQSDGGVATRGEAATGDVDELISRGESPECPECGSMQLYYSEGCKTCESCGWSEC